VLVTVRNAVDTRRLKTENKSYRRDAEKKYQIVGDSPRSPRCAARFRRRRRPTPRC
jgi:hypothetical protein